MEQIALIIFLITYAGVAIGGIPGLALDRTGIALLGAIAMVVAKVLTTRQAFDAIDTATILLLYALMVISAQFKLSGFYTRAALRLTGLMSRPRLFLMAIMAFSALLSAFLTNDIICLVFTPILCVAILEAGMNPVPFLIGLAAASNIGSAATIIGNPQNMLLGQVGRLDFLAFSRACLPPVILALAGAYFILIGLYWRQIPGRREAPAEKKADYPAFNRHQTVKGLIVIAILVILFLTRLPRELSAIALAGFLLCSRRMKTRSLLGLVDWHLITLFCSLFIVMAGIGAAHIPGQIMVFLTARGVVLTRMVDLAVLTTLLSNLVSNVPAVMLLVKILSPAQHLSWVVVALASTFAGNLITIGS
ncbi:MAG: SLC13 family permease, partial [Candidatus Aminicenantes bacterium]|nr:SLC13 family permease [Candidatus Aminicenantes bacterium]